MKIYHFLFLSILLLTLQACQQNNQQAGENENQPVNTEQETPTKMIEYIVGEWQIDNAGKATPQGGQGQQSGQNQRMVFTQEARYIEYSGNQKVDSGAYRMNEQLNNLYLESEVNEKPREFEVQFQENSMTLTPKQSNQQGNQQGDQAMTFRRISAQTQQTSPRN